ncbi:MAG TPA: LytTR family DNA-binding domain-containing protein [Balneolales bacterium]|nr:LytTR family DNA-binding domain-containing protein [Balneolales bacterium]
MIRCLIIDDEPSAREILSAYITDSPQLELAGACNNALEAMDFLGKNPVDLLFLDINMPNLSGISFLKSRTHLPSVIITTAYDEYALEGYELDVVDYLLKPFSFERFLKAVEKAEKRLTPLSPEQNFLLVRADKKTHKIAYADILYIESLGDYVIIHTSTQKLTTYDTLKNLEEQLVPHHFIRVHKSFLVALDKANYMEGNLLVIRGCEIPIGGSYKEEVVNRFMRSSLK